MFCEKCGKEISSEAKYCSYCGHETKSRSENGKVENKTDRKETIQKRIKELGGDQLSFVGYETKNLYTHLCENEELSAIGCASFENRTWLLAITEQRFLMVLNKKVQEIPFKEITHVSFKEGLLTSRIVIETNSTKKEFTQIPKALARKLLNAIEKTTGKTINTATQDKGDKKHGCFFYLAYGFLCLIGLSVLGAVISEKTVDANSDTSNVKENASQTKARKMTSKSEMKKMISKKDFPHLSYVITQMEESKQNENDKRVKLRIVLASKNEKGKIIYPSSHENVNQIQLREVVLSVAKYYAKEFDANFFQIFLDSQKSKNAFGSNLLATLNFPIKGSDSPLLINGASLSASKHGYTEQELKIQKLWGEMRKKYQKDGLTDEDALRNAISQKTGVPANDIHLPDYTDYEEEKFTLKEIQELMEVVQERPALDITVPKEKRILTREEKATKEVMLMTMCDKIVIAQLVHPSTFDKSFWSGKNKVTSGRSVISFSFTAKNSFNLELKYNAVCIFNAKSELEDLKISEQ